MTTVLIVVAVVVLAVAAVGGVLAVFGRRAIGRQRAELERARETGAAAYLCLPPHGQRQAVMAVLIVDGRRVQVVRPSAQPKLLAEIPSAGSTVEPARVRVNVAATVDGVRIAAQDGREVLLALYPDPALKHTKPLAGSELAQAAEAISRALRS